MKKILIISVVIIALLIIFFFPKYAGGVCRICAGPPRVQSWEYGCIGFKSEYQLDCKDCGKEITCFGIVTEEKKCYTYLHGFNSTPTEVPNCKEPYTWQEALNICPNCYIEAAGIATNIQNDTSKAIELCNLHSESFKKDCLVQDKSSQAIEICNSRAENETENCLYMVYLPELRSKQFENAEEFCIQHLPHIVDDCLGGIAVEIAKINLDEGLKMCAKITDQSEKDYCYHNLAVIARQKNVTRALEICGLIKEDKDMPSCKELIQNYCILNPGSVNC